MGEPAGIGPDLCVQIAQTRQQCHLVVIGDPNVLLQRAEQLGLPLSINSFSATADKFIDQAGVLTVLPVTFPKKVQPGLLDSANSNTVLDTINEATQGCLNHAFDALVTAPVHKAIINDAGVLFSGHTEFIAEKTGGQPVMMLATPGLRVALVTTHLPLSDVPSAITQDRLSRIITILNEELTKRFSIAQPNILVCGLNPHAGENGHLGREEIEVITPVLQKLSAKGMHLSGPLPADTLFTPKYLHSADAVLAMYHDQGLPVLKHMGFGKAANITLGLPIIRTSVDHGTALELAGSGQADVGSLQYAIETALNMS